MTSAPIRTILLFLLLLQSVTGQDKGVAQLPPKEIEDGDLIYTVSGGTDYKVNLGEELATRDTANRARGNHTGEQSISTVTGLQTALDDRETVAELDARSALDRARANHTGEQSISTVTGLQTALDARVIYVEGTTALTGVAGAIDGGLYQTRGRREAGDGGGNLYRYIAASTATCDGGFVVDGIGGDNSPGDAAATYAGTGTGRFIAIDQSVADVKKFGAVGDGVAVDTNRVYAAVAAAAGKTLYFPKATYLTDRIIPEADTRIFLDPGTEIVAIPGGTRCFQIQQPDVHVWGYGAKTTMDGSQTSHNIYILQGAVRCSVRGLWADRSGSAGDDCFYIGGDPATDNIPRDISIIDCKGTNPNRNVVSVVAVDGCLIEGGDFSGAVTDAPRAGIDVEANLWMTDGSSAVRHCVIRRNKVHGNTNAGIVIVFGSEVTVEHNQVYGNAGGGISTGAGGTQFNDDVYRTGDLLGIGTFDLATGWMTVTDGTAGNLLTDDLGVNIGMWIVKQTGVGAVWPANVTATRYAIVDIDATQTKIKIGDAIGKNEITSFPSSGTGTLSLDPTVSDLGWAVYGREGNCDKIKILNNYVHGNTGGAGSISISTSANVEVSGNTIRSTITGISSTYSYGIRIEANDVRAATGVSSTARGIHAGQCSNVYTDRNSVHGYPWQGLNVDKTYAPYLGKDRIINCGHNGKEAVYLTLVTSGQVQSIAYNDANYNSTYGIRLLTVSHMLVNGAIARRSGADNATSLNVSGTDSATNVFSNCIQYDGTFRP